MNKLLLAAAVGTVCSVAAAQQGEVAGGLDSLAAPKAAKLFESEIGVNGDYAFRSDVDTGGDVAVTRSMLSVWMGYSFTPEVRATLLATSELSWYDFNNATGIIAGTGKPFGQLEETDLAPGVSIKINDQWMALTGLFFRFAGENDADLGDTYTWGGYGAARYSPNKDFSLTLGVRANTRLEDNAAVLPAIAMDWNITPTVRMQILPAVGGAGLRVSSQINEKVSFLIDGEYQTRAYRLNDSTPLPSGVVRDSRINIGMGVVWKPCDRVQITARAGAVAWQEFEIDDRNGVQQSQSNTDPTPYIFLGGTINF